MRKGLDGRRKRLTEVSSSCVNREEIVLGHDLNLRLLLLFTSGMNCREGLIVECIRAWMAGERG
jgi:hypothetical protein